MFNLNPNNTDNFTKVLDSFYLWTDPDDEHVGKSCRENGYWEPDLTEWMINNIKPGYKCLDIGFNIGYYTEILSRLSGTTGEVWAFEPNVSLIENYNLAKKLNSYTNCSPITVYPFGLSNTNESRYLIGRKDNVGAAHVTFTPKIPNDYFLKTIEVKRLDTVLNEKIDFIKIDIEGHEPFAWEGFPEKVLECPLIIAELGHYHPERFLKSLEENYTMKSLNGENLTFEIIKDPKSYKNGYINMNVVLVKK
jgi:FkbM family methyltransferase